MIARALIGAIVAFGIGAIAYAFTGNEIVGVIATAIAIILLPPEYDPAVQIKQHQHGGPECYGDYPFNAGLCAERDCPECPVGQGCLAKSRERYRKD